MSRGVHIAAIAARTPLGMTAETSAAAVRAGISAIAEHPFMIDPAGERLRGAVDQKLDPALFGWRRMLALAAEALTQLHALGLARVSQPPPVWLGLPELRPGWSEQDAAAVVAGLARVELPGLGSLRVREVARGHAAVLEAMVQARALLESGALECCIVGGVDSYFQADTLDWLAQHRQLACATARAALFPGEAAGFVVLATNSLLRGLRLPSLARLRGSGSAIEPHRIKTEAINLGHGLAAAVEQACAGLEQIDDVYCDINGERYRSEEWGFALLRTQARLVDGTAYQLPSAAWGDVGAASGALFVTLAARAWARGHAGGPLALLCAGSEAGGRAAVVLQESTRR